MSILNTVRGFIMKILNIGTIENVTGVGTLLSSEMRERLELWAEMYAGIAPWQDKAPSCGIEKTLAGTLAQPIGEEIKLQIDNEAIKPVLEKLNSETYRIVEYFVSLGGCLVRPIFSNGRIQYELIPLGNYLPMSYDIDGLLTGCAVTKRLQNGKKFYMLVELHKYENRNHTVTTKLYETTSANGNIIRQVSLETTAQTAGLTEEFTWQNVDIPFVIEFRNRETNRVDGSNVPVPLISGAESMVKDADEQYSRLIWEQEATKARIFVNNDLLRKRQGADGLPENAKVDPKLYNVFVRFNGESDSEQIKIYSPAMRTEQIRQALQEIFKRIELTCNVGKGTLSELEQVQQTATQFAGGRKAFYSKVDTYESEIEEKFYSCAYVFAYMASAYTGVPFNDELSVYYNDMTRKDPAQLRQGFIQEIQAGILRPEEYRMKMYGEDLETAKANLPEKETAGMFGM